MSNKSMSNKGFSSKVVSYTMNNGLAIYSIGEGCPVLLMPYPHGFPTSSTAESTLAQVLLELGYRVITFDPPGAFRSTLPARVSMSEMLVCTEEALHALNIRGPFSIVGHSMGGLCALAYTLTHPERLEKLVLIGSISGGPAIA